MSDEAGLNEEIAILEWKKLQRTKHQVQQAEFDALPKKLLVTYVGDEPQFMHNGRSRAARKNPFHFSKGVPLVVTEPEDIMFFMKSKKPYFKFVEYTEQKIAEMKAEALAKQAEAEKAKAEALAKQAKAEKAEAEKSKEATK